MASSSFNRFADDYYDTNKGFDDGGDDYGSYGDTAGFDDGCYGQRRGLSPRELHERTPKEEILAYSAKLKESEGFDVSDFPNAFIYGPVRPLPNLCGDELALLTQLAKLALADYNQKQENRDNTYKFVKVVMANAAAVNGFDSQTQQHRNEACLSDKDSLLYYGMLAKSEGFDVPDIPNSSEVPGLFRPIKSSDTDNLDKVVKLCKLCTEHYNNKKQVNFKFKDFLKGNKRDSPFSEYYNIEFSVMRKEGKYQTLQAQVLWDEGGNPCVELCREKPGAKVRMF